MAPSTAVLFVLFAVAVLISSSAAARSKVILAGRAIVLVAATGLLLALESYVGAPVFLFDGSFVPPAALSTVAFVLLGISLFGLAARSARPVSGSVEPGARLAPAFKAILALVIVGIITSGIFSYWSYTQQFRVVMEQQLSAIADLKVKELTRWRAEQLANATVLHDNPAFATLVHRWLDSPGTLEPLDLAVQQAAREGQRTGKVHFLDFYRGGPGQLPYLAVLAPILNERDRQPLGTVVLRINPQVFVYPFIGNWPIPSRTAETLLIRREGNEVLYFTNLRFSPTAALTLRFPLTRTDMPPVLAALGKEGVVAGHDYRGRPLSRRCAGYRARPGSWLLVSTARRPTGRCSSGCG